MTSVLAAEPLFRTTGWVPSTLNALAPSVSHLRNSLAKRFGEDHPGLPDIVLAFGDLLGSAIESAPSGDEVRYSYAYDGSAIELKVMDVSAQFAV